MTTATPNPYSPYATANPQHAHIFAVPVFFPAPKPGGLLPTACAAMAVVGEDVIETRPGAELPEGLCPLCVAVMNGGEPPARTTSECGECGSATWHGEWCALCRQEKHEQWWPTHGRLTAERETGLTAALYDSIAAFNSVAHWDVLKHAQLRQYLAEHLADALREMGWDSRRMVCVTCETSVGWIDAPTGGWWAHASHPADGHDAQPRPGVQPSGAEPVEACGKCQRPFDPADTRFDGHARFYLTSYCRGCVGACHDTEIADHRCVICQ